jgi:hypothetical protein
MNNKSAAVVGFCIALVAIGWVMVVAVVVASVITIVKKGIELAQGKPVVSASEWAIAFEELPVEQELPPVAPAPTRRRKKAAVAA